MIPFPESTEFRELIQLARREDLGPAGDDVTSRLLVPEDEIGVGTLVQKSVGIVCGLPIVEHVCRAYDERLKVEQIPGFHMELIEGRFSDQRIAPLLRVRGPMRSLLSAERVILNFLQHLSGIATQTSRFVRRVEETGAKVYDTRKTLPGHRALEKYAVRVGGGMNHRMGLYDGLLIKDNHIASVPLKQLASWLSEIVAISRAESRGRLVEVEVDALDQLREVLKVDGIDVIMLDNMDCPKMSHAVMLRDAALARRDPQSAPRDAGGRLALEASGGVTIETIRSIALTGVERISVGALTHSVTALDIGLDIEPQ